MTARRSRSVREAPPGVQPSRKTRQLALPAVLIGAAAIVLFVAPALGVLALAGVTIHLTLIHRRRSRGRTATNPRPWLRFALATAAVWIALAFVWLITLLSATVGGECSYEEVRCSRAGELLSDYGGYGFLAIVPLAVLIVWWAFPVRLRRTPSVRRRASPSR